MPSEERYELQRPRYGNRLDPRLGGMSSSNRANGLGRNTNDTIIDVEILQNLKDMSSQLFNICKRGDTACFLEEINLLYEHEKNYLYDVLLLQNEEDQDTLLHVAIKGNNVDLVKEILHILGEPYNSDDSYECRYFKDKKENEKPLSKVINARSRESCKALEYIDNEEIAQLFIECYDARIKNLRKELEDSNIQLEQAKRILCRNKLAFAYLGLISFCVQVSRTLLDLAMGLPPVANFSFICFLVLQV